MSGVLITVTVNITTVLFPGPVSQLLFQGLVPDSKTVQAVTK